MERESFSCSCCKAAEREVHHLTRLLAGWCRHPSLDLCTFFILLLQSKQRQKCILIVLCGKSKPSLALVPEDMLLVVVTQVSIARNHSSSAAKRFAWSESQTSGSSEGDNCLQVRGRKQERRPGEGNQASER